MQIVVVDSSHVVLQVIAALLEPRGHAVQAFTDSQAALTFLEATPSVRALITSLDVRPLTGLELCWSARLLADESRPLHIITMSSAHGTCSLAEALDSGADDYMEKPPAAEALYARLRAAERMTTMQEALIRLAETDPLTGLYNRRAFFARATAAAERLGARGSIGVILADIDHFKRINDAHGHDVGDLAIRAVADLVAGEGIAGRLGGEEFALVLPSLNLARTASRAERLRRRVHDLSIPGRSGPVTFTCSFGVSAGSGSDSVAFLLKQADIGLYAAKGAGRDRVASGGAQERLAAAG